MKKKIIISVLAVVIILAIVLGAVFGVPYYKRHFVTVTINSENAVEGEKVDIGDKVLIAYFTRAINADLDDNVDAVSGASLMTDEASTTDDGKLIGNAQLLAMMVQNATGGDLFPIKTENKYPSTYKDTTKVAGEEYNDDIYPDLATEVENFEQYDTIFIVYPVWWGTLPMAVMNFVSQYDFAGKTVIPLSTDGGSGYANSVSDLRSICPGDVSSFNMSVYCDDVPTAREQITQWLKQFN